MISIVAVLLALLLALAAYTRPHRHCQLLSAAIIGLALANLLQRIGA